MFVHSLDILDSATGLGFLHFLFTISRKTLVDDLPLRKKEKGASVGSHDAIHFEACLNNLSLVFDGYAQSQWDLIDDVLSAPIEA